MNNSSNNNNTIFSFYTIGYSKKTIDQFINLLKNNNVHILIDVRKNAFSYKPDFNKVKLQSFLEKARIKYWHMPELGVPSNRRKDLKNKNIEDKTQIYTELWKWYDENVIPNNLNNLISQLSIVNQPVAFMCSEVKPTECHRHRIARALDKKGMKGKDL